MANEKKPGNDKPVEGNSTLTVIKAIREYKREAEEARKERMNLNRVNRQTYLGQQDWSHKQKGQSKEFLPKVPVAAEQFAAFIERALIQFGDWFSVEMGKQPSSLLAPEQIRDLMRCYLDSLADGFNKTIPFPIRVADGAKSGLLESLIIFKVHGYKVPERVFFAERGIKFIEREENGRVVRQPVQESTLKDRTIRPWRLAIDLVPAKDYYPDPTGRGLYEIHEVERDLHDVEELADQGIYDKEVVAEIKSDFADEEDRYVEARLKNQMDAQPPGFRKRVKIWEFWGDILDAEGHVVMRNALAAVANEKYLIRSPEPNPLWHGESPFVVSPLIRVPQSVWHKALYDHASPLNISLNELFSLMLDGGLSSVWGINQLRMDGLQNPSQVSGGIPQGITLIVKEGFPQEGKVLENVVSGKVPPEALAMFNLADREFNQAALTNDLKMGLLPPKQVKATEIIEIQQSQAVTLDSISGKVEQLLIAPVLRKVWLTILQNADDLDSDQVIAAIGPRAALLLARMTPAERFAAFAKCCQFKVFGLSATLAKVRDFQKLMALNQAVMSNPILMQAFMMKFSPDKTLTHLMKTLNVNPEHIMQDEAEKAAMPGFMANLPMFMQLANPKGKGMAAEDAGEPGLPAEIAQQANPMTGMAGS